MELGPAVDQFPGFDRVIGFSGDQAADTQQRSKIETVRPELGLSLACPEVEGSNGQRVKGQTGSHRFSLNGSRPTNLVCYELVGVPPWRDAAAGRQVGKFTVAQRLDQPSGLHDQLRVRVKLKGSVPMSGRRVMDSGAELVCRVDNTRWSTSEDSAPIDAWFQNFLLFAACRKIL